MKLVHTFLCSKKDFLLIPVRYIWVYFHRRYLKFVEAQMNSSQPDAVIIGGKLRTVVVIQIGEAAAVNFELVNGDLNHVRCTTGFRRMYSTTARISAGADLLISQEGIFCNLNVT